MNSKIRMMQESDRNSVLTMMREFYASSAVLSNGSEKIFETDFDCCVNATPFLEGYVFENNGMIQGYAMVAKSFSTEYGKPCIWVEDLYLKAEYRGLGIGSSFLSFIETKYPEALFRLEVEKENEKAVRVYEACGYQELPYMEMKKN